MRAISLIAAVLILASCGTDSFEGTAYGAPLTVEEVTDISTVLGAPEQYVGERVLVEGTVVEVCDKKGCWIDLVGEDPDQRLQVKVEDDVIVFPATATGSRARVEGLVEKLERTREDAMAAAQHRAEEQGEPFDSTAVAGPETVYRIQGTGALIAEHGA